MKYTTALLIIIMLGFAACEVPMPETAVDVEDVVIEAREDGIAYSFTVLMPTPCHELTVQESVSANEARITLEASAGDEVCAQIITPQEVSGLIETDQQPERFVIRSAGETVHQETVSWENGEAYFTAPLDIRNETYTIEDGILSYSFIVSTPTPCYEVQVEETVRESAPPQVHIDVKIRDLTLVDPDLDACMQVVSDETVTGEVEIYMNEVASFTVGSSLDEEELSEPVDRQYDRVSTTYEDGVLHYSFTVMKPTPCHEVHVEEVILESYPAQIVLNARITDSGEMCIQVIDEELITGEIEIDHEPSLVSLRVEGEAGSPPVQ